MMLSWRPGGGYAGQTYPSDGTEAMANSGNDTRSLMLMALIALWLAAYGYSVSVLLAGEAKPPATLTGPGRMSGFLGWQGVAGVIGFACWGVGRSLPKGAGIRKISAVPLAMAFALGIVVAGLAWFGGEV